MERQRQINSILSQRVNNPPGLSKGYPKKHWCYERIEIAILGKNHEFLKRPKKSYDTENSKFNQLDFPINHLFFTSTQFKIVKNFNDKDEFKRLNIRFHVVLGKNEEEVVFGEDYQNDIDCTLCVI